MHTGIELCQSAFCTLSLKLACTYHDCLALVLENVAGTANLVATTQAQEHQLISWVYGLDVLGLHRRMLSLGRHVCVSVWLGWCQACGL
jgi:hypothetical protein